MRKVNTVGDRGSKPTVVPKTKPKGKPKGVVFRTPHPGLEVIVKQGKRIEQGAGNYSIVPPETVEFENRGNYGEATVSEAEAVVLREIAKSREDRGLPKKFIEV